MRKNRLTALIGVAGAMALVLTGCSSGSSETAATAAASAPAAATAAASAAAGTIALPQDVADKGYIVVASDLEYPPMEMVDESGNPTGFDIDLAKAIGEVLGVEMRIEKQAFDAMIPALESGQRDIVMSSMNDTEERRQKLSFVDYFQAGMKILVAKGNPEGITTITDLCGKDVAIQSGTSQAALLEKVSAEQCPDGQVINVSQLPDDTDAQNAVRSGKAVADVLDAFVADDAAATAGNGEWFEVVQDPANPSGYEFALIGIGVLKDRQELVDALQQALTVLLENGTYQALLDKYGLGTYAVSEITVNAG